MDADIECRKDEVLGINKVDIQLKWRDNSYSFTLQLSSPLSELKHLIQGLTTVPSTSQKLIGLTKKVGQKLIDDNSLEWHQPALKNGVIKITLIGTPDEEIAKFQEKVLESSTVFNDFSHGYSPATKEWQQLQEFSEKTSINFINEPRAGKKLLVLDLDHTLLDFSSKEEIQPSEMKVNVLWIKVTQIISGSNMSSTPHLGNKFLSLDG
jgi:ubiquitin-like domain-containing CTD phosphatase 1